MSAMGISLLCQSVQNFINLIIQRGCCSSSPRFYSLFFFINLIILLKSNSIAASTATNHIIFLCKVAGLISYGNEDATSSIALFEVSPESWSAFICEQPILSCSQLVQRIMYLHLCNSDGCFEMMWDFWLHLFELASWS